MPFLFVLAGGSMTEKQKDVCYYRLKGYSVRRSALIAGVSDAYARKILSDIYELDLGDYCPGIDCVIRRRVLDHIVEGAGYAYIPKSEKYAYMSLLGYLGYTYKELREMFPEDQPQFIYMALHRSDKAWRNLDASVIGVDQEDYDNLLRIRR
jgi:hypothetical protein